MTDLPEGSRVDGYRVRKVLGRGGMGVVYEAEDERIGRRVALKVVARELAADARFLERFHREARALGGLAHPNVATILGAGEVAGSPYFALEYLPGGSLKDAIRGQGKLPWRRACEAGAQIAAGLGALHKAGIVHRDLKPENVLLDADGRAKLA